jgi:hypothetical protein
MDDVRTFFGRRRGCREAMGVSPAINCWAKVGRTCGASDGCAAAQPCQVRGRGGAASFIVVIMICGLLSIRFFITVAA